MQEHEIIGLLTEAGIDNARFEAGLLLKGVKAEGLDEAVRRRAAGYPLQYLLGEWDFYRETYEVSEDCLIPRSDTEILVEQAVKLLPQSAHFLDLCTGSGCIAVSTLCARPDATAIAVDLFEPTLALAARNAKRNGADARVSFLRADVLQKPPTGLCEGGFDAILSNPPYIRGEAMAVLQREVTFEPRAALYGGEDGLDFYRAILKNWRKLLKPEGFVLLEIGYDQADELLALGKDHGLSGQVFRDYGGNDRVVYLKQ